MGTDTCHIPADAPAVGAGRRAGVRAGAGAIMIKRESAVGREKDKCRTMRSSRLIVLVSIVFAVASSPAAVWQPSSGHAQLPLWPAAIPDAAPVPGAESAVVTQPDHFVAGKPFMRVNNVTQPTMTVYSPATANTGVAVVVFPGGGYKDLAIDLEGTEVCDWLIAKGITCVLLEVPRAGLGPHWEAKCDCHVDAVAPTALEDAQRTVGLGSLSRRRVAHRSAQDRRAGVFGGWTSGGGCQHALGQARISRSRCGRHGKLPSGLRGGDLSGPSNRKDHPEI